MNELIFPLVDFILDKSMLIIGWIYFFAQFAVLYYAILKVSNDKEINLIERVLILLCIIIVIIMLGGFLISLIKA